MTGDEPAPPAVPAPHPPAEFVVVPRWRWRVYVHPASWALALGTVVVFVFVVIVAVAANMLLAEVLRVLVGPELEERWVVRAAEFVAHTALVGGGFVLLHWVASRAARAAAQSFAATIPGTDPARGYMLAELRESGPPKDSWSARRAGRWVAVARSHGAARLYLGQSLADRVRHYDRTDHPVEPERIGPGAGGGAWHVGVLLVLVAVFSWQFGWLRPVPIVLGAIALLSVIRLFRRRAMLVPVVAGQGWVQHGKARWTAADSVIVASGWPVATVRVVGPPGVLVVSLRTGRHQDLEALWVRWMHPTVLADQRPFE